MEFVRGEPASDAVPTHYRVGGAKNHLLPLAYASLLSIGSTRVSNTPTAIRDWPPTAQCLRSIGASVTVAGDAISIKRLAGSLNFAALDAASAAETRYSLLMLGVAAAEGAELTLPMPGGCGLSRQHDIHIEGLRLMGHTVHEGPSGFTFRAGRPRACAVKLRVPSVGATLNLLLAATGSVEPVHLYNIAREPEVTAVTDYLVSRGVADVGDIGERAIMVRKAPVRPPVTETNIALLPDRIITVTAIVAAQLLQRALILEKTNPFLITKELSVLRDINLNVQIIDDTTILVRPRSFFELRSTTLETAPYPGFSTDSQPIVSALLARISGISEVKEFVFTSRFQYVTSINRIRNCIEIDGDRLIILGDPSLPSLPQMVHLKATDIRGGMAACLFALSLGHHVELANIHEIERGYGSVDEFLSVLGVECCENSARIFDPYTV
ncbi:hypothetical protein [Mesorhizobium sp.]|uniref:hypothetical protein n=1 Tax=Mesorhizobium sp. TaxID=1871066 RepID=UPI000FE6676A|nr:hypothetical protein [Mesorhizobium sp.]RWE56387.1 MAG: hypothetical protein EOS67_18435 [Mesorhizobium sp.]